MAGILITGVIAGYSIRVVWKKYKSIRKGELCGGCCRDCRNCKKR